MENAVAATTLDHPERLSGGFSDAVRTEYGGMNRRKLKAARSKLGLTPTEMARAMGVSYDTYKQWQSGKRSMSASAERCVELLLKHPRTAREFSKPQ